MVSPFASQVYTFLKQVPKGRVTTYKALAEALGTKAYQAVGTAMKNNPYAPQVPCHRVVSANGTIGGFRGQKSGQAVADKKKMLRQEGIEFEGSKITNFGQVFFKSLT